VSERRGDREIVPAALRSAVRGELTPVTPLAPPWRRGLGLAAPALVAVLAMLGVLGRLGIVAEAGWLSFPGGGVAFLEWAAGFLLLWLALREAVPGLGLGAGRAAAAIAGGIGLQVALGLVVWSRTGAGAIGANAVAVGSECASIAGVIGLPHLAVAIWLAARALPIRPRWSGALAGAAAGLLADAIWHLGCARFDLEHLLVWHLGATLGITLAGALAGSFWTRRA